jgi:glyoxylase-like metal-dependent hydrolase (beta-lactamase superfamily II)
VILERSMAPGWLSNSYVVGDRAGGHAVLIDAGGPVEPILEAIERFRLTVTHVLLTHHHGDHVAQLEHYLDRFSVPVLAHPLEAAQLQDVEGSLVHGDVVESGDLRIECLHTPGHTDGMLAFLVNGAECFTGDTLFAGSVGGVRAPGSTSFADLRRSVMDVLMGLDPGVVIEPGHVGHSTIGVEWETNAFVRLWRGLDEEGAEPCTALGEPATLVLWGDDYDGGHKAWVRWPDGRDDIVGGSRVERSGAA